MLECIYHKYFGGKLFSFLCCHVWRNIEAIEEGNIVIEKNQCVDCEKKRNFIINKMVKEA